MDSNAAGPAQRAGGGLTDLGGRAGATAAVLVPDLTSIPLASGCCSKANMSHPTQNWGFWRTDKHNGKFELNADPAVSKLPGRRAANLAE